MISIHFKISEKISKPRLTSRLSQYYVYKKTARRAIREDYTYIKKITTTVRISEY